MAIWPFLIIGQFFGVMPIIGVKNRSLSALHFEWKCFRTFYSLAVATLLLSYSILLIWRMITIQIELDLIGNVNPTWCDYHIFDTRTTSFFQQRYFTIR